MFSQLHGTILSIEDGKIDLLVHNTGLGLEILIPIRTLAHATIGEERKFFIHHHITEASEVLFGFESREEKAMFRQLLKVSGIGGKTALPLLSLGIRPLVEAIQSSDEKFLSSIPGIGKKMALKIILELKNQVSIEDISGSSVGVPQYPASTDVNSDITDALITMGYDRKVVEKVTATIPSTLSGLQDRMVYCIKMLAR